MRLEKYFYQQSWLNNFLNKYFTKEQVYLVFWTSSFLTSNFILIKTTDVPRIYRKEINLKPKTINFQFINKK